MNSAQVRVSTAEELVAVGEALNNSWFRGQGSDQWGLKSTLELDAERFKVPRKCLWEREQTMLRLFKERAHLYNQTLHTPKTEFDWFALIRHYGGPSRLLDVTTSYLVATYFALSDSQEKSDAAIWAFCGPIPPEEKIVPDTLFTDSSKLGLLEIASPERLNDRMNAQSGAFIIPGSVTTSLEVQVGEKFNTDLKAEPSFYKSVNDVKTETHHIIWKIIIPRAVHGKIFRFLSRCNVRGYSLFPGIDGLAASLREMMRVYD